MITNCIDCQYHKVIADPDPEDWFCDDDVAVICTHPESGRNLHYDPWSKYKADNQPRRTITVSCRPHHVREESATPEWCPLRASESAA